MSDRAWNIARLRQRFVSGKTSREENQHLRLLWHRKRGVQQLDQKDTVKSPAPLQQHSQPNEQRNFDNQPQNPAVVTPEQEESVSSTGSTLHAPNLTSSSLETKSDADVQSEPQPGMSSGTDEAAAKPGSNASEQNEDKPQIKGTEQEVMPAAKAGPDVCEQHEEQQTSTAEHERELSRSSSPTSSTSSGGSVQSSSSGTYYRSEPKDAQGNHLGLHSELVLGVIDSQHYEPFTTLSNDGKGSELYKTRSASYISQMKEPKQLKSHRRHSVTS